MDDAQFDALIELLESRNPDDRKRAIAGIAKSGDGRGLRYLAAVHKNDPEPALRELAVKAGRYLKKEIETAKWVGTGSESVAAAAEQERKKKGVPISPEDEKQAKEWVEASMTYYTKENIPLAEDYLRRAFQLNPNLQYDQYAMGLGQGVFGLTGDDLLTELHRKDIPPANKRKRKAKAGVDEVSTDTVLIDLALYWVVQGAVMFIGFLFVANQFGNMLASVDVSQYPEAAESLSLYQSMAAWGIPFILIYSVLYSLFSVISLVLFHYLPLHFSATMILGGEGTFKQMVHKLTLLQTIAAALFGLIGLGIMYVTASATIDLMTTVINNPNITEEALLNQYSAAFSSIPTLGLISFFGSLIYLGVYVTQIGKVYDFGAMKGCAAVIMSAVVLGIVSCLLSVTLQSVLTSLFMGPNVSF